MLFQNYKPLEIEPAILEYWNKNKILENRRKKNTAGQNFYFLEGPPYTSGNIHLGHAWNMALKDMVLRYKRARDFNVWDRMGYDMHGLPTEQKVMAKLNLNNKEEIIAFGLDKFAKECKAFCTEMMHKMNKDFIRIGSTLNFSNPYQPINNEFMEAEWWLIKKAHEKGRLYQGLKTMHWDAATQSAVAKHELEYKELKDTAIYVKFPHRKKKNTYFIVWTTTPWTIPLNLALMVNPDVYYVEANIEDETWILAKDLLEPVMKKAKIEKFKIKKTVTGTEMQGQTYNHPLKIKQYLPLELQKNHKLFTVLLSKEYVDTSTGTGLVHCAPGCGPEDYEVGHRNRIAPFNCVNEQGFFENFGECTGLKAKVDDQKFIEMLEDSGALIVKESYVHDYPHGERSHQPVIFRTTKQWFFKVEDLTEKLIKANDKVYWNPQTGKNAFTSWLENLRDNSITKQRFWGTAVPIWECRETGEYLVISSIAELEKLSGQKVNDMHIPEIDKITINKEGKTFTRIPDVLDVWIDAGTVSWNCLDYPKNKELFKELFPADFILEGKDQIRGWFNLLMIASFLAFDKPAFKNVFMHGFVTDIEGMKMSKSLGNIISPYELIEKHGADTLRYYMTETVAGEDFNFSWEEAAIKNRNLLILWNIHKLLINLSQENKINPAKLKAEQMYNVLGPEEKYIISRMNSTIKNVTQLMEHYRLNEVIAPLEKLFFELSRTYIQMVRDKLNSEDDLDKEVCLFTIYTVLMEVIKMFSITAPFISEAIYLNLKQEFSLTETSIGNYDWPKQNEKRIELELERQMDIAKNAIQAILGGREKMKLGVRWPIKELIITTKDEKTRVTLASLKDLILKQTNIKSMIVMEKLPGIKFKVKPNYSKIGPAFGQLSPQVITRLTIDSPESILSHLEKENAHHVEIDNQEISITEDMLIIEREIPPFYREAEFNNGFIYLNTDRTEELEAEGFVRETIRNIQQLRKDYQLQKLDNIILFLKVSEKIKKYLAPYVKEMKSRIGAKEMDLVTINPVRKYQNTGEFSIKDERMILWFEKM